MNIKTIAVSLVLFASTIALHAQVSPQIVNSSGTTITNDSYSLTYSVGEVAIQLYDGLGEGFLASSYSTLEKALGFQNTTVKKVSVFPNPAQDLVTVTGVSERINQALIYDVNGRRALVVQVENQRFDVSKLAAGIYTVLFTTSLEAREIVARTVIKKLN